MLYPPKFLNSWAPSSVQSPPLPSIQECLVRTWSHTMVNADFYHYKGNEKKTSFIRFTGENIWKRMAKLNTITYSRRISDNSENIANVLEILDKLPGHWTKWCSRQNSKRDFMPIFVFSRTAEFISSPDHIGKWESRQDVYRICLQGQSKPYLMVPAGMLSQTGNARNGVFTFIF